MRVRFGDFLFDGETRQLTCAGAAVQLTPKAFELLRALLEHRPRALSKQELHDVLWPDTFVVDVGLARLVSEVRKAIGDPARAPRFIRTVHGYGYAFGGEVSEADGPSRQEPPACWLVSGRRLVPLAWGPNGIGRSVDSVLMIDSARVSRRHARVVVSDTGAMIEDLGSKNGTYVEGKRLDGPVKLEDGDQITIGPLVLVFRCGEGGDSTETELTAMGEPLAEPEPPGS